MNLKKKIPSQLNIQKFMNLALPFFFHQVFETKL